MTFMFGFLGALTAAALLSVGVVGGWQAHRIHAQHTRHRVQPPEEQERRRLEQEQKAFHLLQNYSAERAYGLMQDEELNGHGVSMGGERI